MKVGEVIDRMSRSGRVIITEKAEREETGAPLPTGLKTQGGGEKTPLFTGFVDILVEFTPEWERIREREVKGIGTQQEITHRDWRARGLRPPLEPGEVAEYRFKDLQAQIYTVIEV